MPRRRAPKKESVLAVPPDGQPLISTPPFSPQSRLITPGRCDTNQQQTEFSVNEAYKILRQNHVNIDLLIIDCFKLQTLCDGRHL